MLPVVSTAFWARPSNYFPVQPHGENAPFFYALRSLALVSDPTETWFRIQPYKPFVLLGLRAAWDSGLAGGVVATPVLSFELEDPSGDRDLSSVPVSIGNGFGPGELPGLGLPRQQQVLWEFAPDSRIRLRVHGADVGGAGPATIAVCLYGYVLK